MGETTTVNVTPTPNVETQEYRDSMVNKIEQANAVPSQPLTTPQQEVKQEKILGKFNSQEDLIKSYQELEKKLSSQKAPVAEQPTKNENPLQASTKSTQPSSVGSVFQTAEQEFNETGELSDATIASLEKSGLPKQYVDNYLKGLEAFISDYPQATPVLLYRGKHKYKERDILCCPVEEFLLNIRLDRPLFESAHPRDGKT